MKRLISCEFNIDTACVELYFTDESKISIDCTAVENEVADNRFQRSELEAHSPFYNPKSVPGHSDPAPPATGNGEHDY